MYDPPWLDRREAVRAIGKGVTHAIVLGISAYPYVHDAPEKTRTSNEDFGRGQLTTAASSAYGFAKWLRDEYRNPQFPLGSIRLLLAPSDAENVADDDLRRSTRGTPELSAEVAISAMRAWRQDCRDDSRAQTPEAQRSESGSFAVLYACCHGVAMGDAMPWLLTQDFAKTPASVEGSIETRSVHRQMWACVDQLVFFLDCCRTSRVGIRELTDYGSPKHIGEPVSPEAVCPATSPVFCSTSMEREAYVGEGGGTVFSRALKRCLENDAFDHRDGNWVITSRSLDNALGETVPEEAAKLGPTVTQRPHPLGQNSGAIFHLGDSWPWAPWARVSMLVKPDQARQDVTCTLQSRSTRSPINVPFNSNPYDISVRADYYEAVAATRSPWYPQREPVWARPPYTQKPILDMTKH